MSFALINPQVGGRGAVMVYHVTFVSHMLAADHSNPLSLLDEHNWSDPMGSSNVLSVCAAKSTLSGSGIVIGNNGCIFN